MLRVPRFRVLLFVSAALFVGFRSSIRGEGTPDTSPTSRPSISLADIRDALPPGQYVAEIIGILPTPRLQELAQRVQAAWAADPAWLADYIKKNAKSDGPLPYNSKFGISKAEYGEFIKLAESVGMGVVGHFDLTIDAIGKDGIRFHGPVAYAGLNAIAINFGSGQLSTRYAKVVKALPLAGTMRTFGQWAGQEWRYESGGDNPSTNDITTVDCSVGKMNEGGAWVLSYHDGHVKDGRPVEPTSNYSLFLHRKSN